MADCVHLEDLNKHLDKELSDIKDKLDYSESDRADLVNFNTKLKDDNKFLVSRVQALEASLGNVKSKDELDSAVDELEATKNRTEQILKDKVLLEEEIEYLKLSDKNQKAINIRLNSEMNRFRARLLKEKTKLPSHSERRSNCGKRNLEMKEGRR